MELDALDRAFFIARNRTKATVLAFERHLDEQEAKKERHRPRKK